MSLLCTAIVRGTLEDVQKHCTKENMEAALQYGLNPVVLASLRGDEQIMKFVLAVDGFPDSSKETAVTISAANGDVGIVRLLLGRDMRERGHFLVHSERPLHIAAIYGHAVVVKQFLDAGFSAESAFEPPDFIQNEERVLNRYGRDTVGVEFVKLTVPLTPLEFASFLGHVDVVRVLLDNDEEPWRHSKRALHLAAVERRYSSLVTSQEASDHEKVVHMLLEAGYDVDSVQFDLTPLCVAAKLGSVGIVKILLDAGAHVNVELDYEPLYWAIGAEKNQAEIVEMMIAKGADVFDVDSRTSTYLHYAAAAGKNEAVKLLLECGLDPNSEDIDSRTPLHRVAIRAFTLDLPWICFTETVDLLLSYGARVDISDDNGITVLHIACRYACCYAVNRSSGEKPPSFSTFVELCRKLLKAGADPNVATGFRTPLSFAVAVSEDTSLTDLLVSFGANVNLDSSQVLHSACSVGSLKNVTALLEYGSQEKFIYGGQETLYFMSKRHSVDPFEFHFIKMSAAGLSSSKVYVKDPSNEWTTDPSAKKMYEAQCEEEVGKLKQNNIGDSNITFYKLLQKSSPVYRGEFADAVRSLVLDDSRLLQNDYPIYWRLLTINIRKGLKRGELYEEGHFSFKRIPCIQLLQLTNQPIQNAESVPDFPPLVTDQIFSYMTDGELTNFNSAVSVSRKRNDRILNNIDDVIIL